jgi:hypothetical protein
MPDDASNDWLEVAKTRAQGIRAALAGIGVFVACVLVTIFGQLRQFEADRKAIAVTACFVGDPVSGTEPAAQPRNQACPAAADWGILQAAYEEFPVQQIDAELTPWNQFAMQSSIVATFIEGKDEPGALQGMTDSEKKLVHLLADASSATPVKPGIAAKISHFYLHLKNFDSNARSIEWAVNAKIPFDNLDRDKIIALANAFTFNLDDGDAQGENAAKGLANPAFIAQLNRLRPSIVNTAGQPIVEDRFVKTLQTGASLDQFTTLRQQLTVYDLAKFDHVDDAEMAKLLPFLAATPFTSLAAERNEYTRLDNEITAITRDGDMNSAITLPFLNLSVNLSDFAYLSGILNLALLGWVFWQVRQMDNSLGRYLAFPDADKSRIEAALQGLPGSGSWNLLLAAGLALLVTMPTLLGTFVLFTPLWFLGFVRFHWWSLLYLILPAVVFLISLALVTFIQKSNRQALDVPREPPGGTKAAAA